MTHALIDQLRFTRSEFLRGVKGVGNEDAAQRFLPMNCISWNVGHLAAQEQSNFLTRTQGIVLLPEVHKSFTFGAPASTPPLDEIVAAWKAIITATDPWLDTLTSEALVQPYIKRDGQPAKTTIGNLVQRVIYHYWYHNGENQAMRQLLGHKKLPQYVGNIDDEAPYRPS